MQQAKIKCEKTMEFTYQAESVIRGHHIYKTVWTPFIGEPLSLRIQDGNEQDSFAVTVIKNDNVVGHAPRQFSRVFYFFLSHDGTIDAEITENRKFGCGLEVPCLYTLTGKPKFIKHAKKLVKAKQLKTLS